MIYLQSRLNFLRGDYMEKQFIVWYRYDGEMDFMIISATCEDDARRKFYGYSSSTIDDIHEIAGDESHLAYS